MKTDASQRSSRASCIGSRIYGLVARNSEMSCFCSTFRTPFKIYFLYVFFSWLIRTVGPTVGPTVGNTVGLSDCVHVKLNFLSPPTNAFLSCWSLFVLVPSLVRQFRHPTRPLAHPRTCTLSSPFYDALVHGAPLPLSHTCCCAPRAFTLHPVAVFKALTRRVEWSGARPRVEGRGGDCRPPAARS